MALPPVSSPSVVNYDFLDITTGKGILTLYGGDHYSPSKTWILTPNTFYASDGSTYVGAGATLDIDFDLVLKRPLIVEGTCLVTAPIYVQAPAATAITPTIYFRKWDGSTETEYASSAVAYTTGTSAGQSYVINAMFDIPNTSFKIGETVRISVACGTLAKNVEWYYDPANRTAINGSTNTLQTSRFQVLLPVKVDV